MDNEIALYLVISFAILGAIIFCEGLTGYITSQSCCFGAECSVENQCSVDVNRPINESPELSTGIYSLMGIGLLLVISVFLYLYSVPVSGKK